MRNQNIELEQGYYKMSLLDRNNEPKIELLLRVYKSGTYVHSYIKEIMDSCEIMNLSGYIHLIKEFSRLDLHFELYNEDSIPKGKELHIETTINSRVEELLWERKKEREKQIDWKNKIKFN